MPGFGLPAETVAQWQPYAVDVDPPSRTPRLGQWAAVLVLALALLIAARPSTDSFEREVAIRRRKRPPQQRLELELRAFVDAPLKKLTVGGLQESSEESGLWSSDLLIATVGCTQKTCFVGAVGRWLRLPRWERHFDLYAMLGMHCIGVFLCYQCPGTFFEHFSPRLSHPHTVVLGMFACTSPVELLWLVSFASWLGRDLQKMIGRLGAIALYVACGLSSSLASAILRRSATGAGGLLGAFAYHTLAAPNASHNILGIALSPPKALLAQFIIMSWDVVTIPDQRLPLIICNGLPTALGAVMFFVRKGGVL